LKRMKILVTIIVATTFIFGSVGVTQAKTYNPKHGKTYTVNGYYTKKGTYVKPYKRTRANHTIWDNLYIP